MPSNPPFIFTEEDYRTYPRTFAPFVNLVQQVLMENELCLIGVSGNDPNFIQWSGWIRDQLGDTARRIYLIGVLHLSTAHRKYLEARRVIPIDLSPIVADAGKEEHPSLASSLFLDFLHNSKPKPAWAWRTSSQSIRSQQLLGMSMNKSDSAELVKAFQGLIADWRLERATYPGWLVCPSTERTRIRHEIGNPEYVFRQVQKHLQPSEEIEALYEMTWRLDLAFLPLSEWFRGVLANAIENSSPFLTREQRLEIGVKLLRIAREEHDRSSFDRWSTFLTSNAGSDADVHASVAYEQSLWARDRLDYPAVASLVPTIAGEDPAWRMRRASLHFELGEFDEGTTLCRQVLQELRDRYLRDRKSIWVLSRLAWALFLLRAAMQRFGQPKSDEPLVASSEWPDYFARNKCLPWDQLEEIDVEIGDEFRERIEDAKQDEPGFEPGTYRKTAKLLSSSGWAEHNTTRLIDLVGLPTLIGSVDLMRSRLSRTLELATRYDENGLLRVIRVLNSPSDKLIPKAFSRAEVARMPFSTVQRLIDTLWRDIAFARTRFGVSGNVTQSDHGNFWVDRVQVMVEVLSRLIVRLTGDNAIAAFRQTITLAHAPDWHYWVLFKPLGKLLFRSLLAVPPGDRSGLLLEILNLPLPDERGIYGQGARGPLDDWPEILTSPPPKMAARRSEAPGFATRIATFITKLSHSDPLTRERCALRLICLLRMGLLTPEESILFGRARGYLPSTSIGEMHKRDSHHLLPAASPLLDDADLVLAAQWYVEGFTQRSGIKTNLQVSP